MKTLLFCFVAVLALGAASLSAQDIANSEIQGFRNVTAAADSDTLVVPVLGREAVWAGLFQSLNGDQLGVAGAPGWTAGQFVSGTDTYYVRVLSGALSGHYFVITANDGVSVTVDSAGLDLTQLAAGDQLEVAPFWTLGTLYPAANANVSFVPSASPLAPQTELLFHNAAGVGINRATTLTYFFYNGSWRKTGGSIAVSFDHTVVLPDTYFLQRNPNVATTLTLSGRVFNASLGTVITGQPGARQDNYVGLAFPVTVTLGNSGLAGSPAFAASSSPLSPSDELLVFTPGQTGINRAPGMTYFYYNSGWRRIGDSVANDHSSDPLTAGGGFVLRKAANAGSGSWIFQTNL